MGWEGMPSHGRGEVPPLLSLQEKMFLQSLVLMLLVQQFN